MNNQEEMEQRSAHEGSKRRRVDGDVKRRVTRNSNKQRDQVSGSDDLTGGGLDQARYDDHNSSVNDSSLASSSTSDYKILHHNERILLGSSDSNFAITEIPEASTPTSEKFLIKLKDFNNTIEDYIKDENSKQAILKKLQLKSSSKNQNNTKIFLKVFDFNNLDYLKLYLETYEYLNKSFTKADEHRLGTIDGYSISEINEMQEREFANELNILSIIQAFNAKQKESKDRINIPKIYCSGDLIIMSSKIGSHRGNYIAMELIDSVNEKPKTVAQFKSLKTQLDNLHSSGIHHGDVHERNCCVVGRGKVMLFDFGQSCLVKDLEKKSKNCLNKTCEDYKNIEEMMKKYKIDNINT
ncbi:hypothetical protein BN7_3014 [Wickerhamomyces ciferrii]|uniref:ABC1 atypical kinase-like domain-containing protein n=1 Tax=Wickerhamomyces ciferrii (strain ATCC 14091 / BCRC 22168 / CBS 111 / JCM 3599 / NBRC 0793 / NRRL Y-1031 F-60-10) TaxID=1206466 RepID=K0KPW3_WICCF|nr:uncharacterized protein BN7_3014 [Wickerhamomyces ciferrii]CCH43464.1 hypothetical protein BN7_3014 [Wickerhamomyces ciferrii]